MNYPTVTINDKEYKNVYGFHFHAKTNDKVIDALVNLYTSGTRCRIFYGDIETGESWLDEYDVTGTIGRSTGSIKISLIINNANSSGGPGILEHCIVAIQVKGKFLYKQDNFHVPEMDIRENAINEYPFAIYANGEVHARFKTRAKAERLMTFLKGERMSK